MIITTNIHFFRGDSHFTCLMIVNLSEICSNITDIIQSHSASTNKNIAVFVIMLQCDLLRQQNISGPRSKESEEGSYISVDVKVRPRPCPPVIKTLQIL